MANRKKVNVGDQLVSLAKFLPDDIVAHMIINSQGWEEVVKQYSNKDEDNKVAYPSDPVEFMTKVLGYQMWPKIEEILRSVQNNHNTVVASGRGVGKSLASAAIACWFLVTNNPSIVITMAPVYDQVQNIIWRYIRAAGRAANLPGTILDTPRWEMPNSDAQSPYYAMGISPRKSSEADAITGSGYHAAKELIIMDEAAGLDRPVWNNAAGLAVGDGCRILAIGNPIEQVGPFWDACNSPDWNFINISSFEHPNIVSGEELVPGAVTRRWIDMKARETCTPAQPGEKNAIEIPWTGQWYIPDPVFNTDVLGVAPAQGEDQLISLSWVNDAKLRGHVDTSNEGVIAGFDPAPHGGDDNALVVRQGNNVLKVARMKGDNTIIIAQWLKEQLAEWKVDKVFIDEIGSGKGVADQAKLLKLPVVYVNVGKKALRSDLFINLRAEVWWRVKELLRSGRMSLPNDSLLCGDLIAPRKKRGDRGKIQIEEKDEIRKRIKRSPDTGDALCISYTNTIVDSLPDDVTEDLGKLGAITGAESELRNQESKVGSWTMPVANKKSSRSRWHRG